MTTTLLGISIAILLILVVLIILIFNKLKNPEQMESVKAALAIFGSNLDKINGSLRDEFQRNREESSKLPRIIVMNSRNHSNHLMQVSPETSGNSMKISGLILRAQ
ncbi:MAG: hypothetical protein IPN67_06075 [Bacteroidales bacterium]|nr:hypothetical protein [Bacteroidales bacterium]